MAASRPPVPPPLFADSPADQFRRGWQHATDPDDNGAVLHHPVDARTPRWHWWALVLITLFGGAIRFAWLDRPAIWGDEAATFMRVCGTYSQLLEQLATTRFMPLHYQALWLLGQSRPDQSPIQTLSPVMMRLIPAIAGTLMAPAMYFLARQLVNRRASLLTALFTACSAYIFVYSRDAKMYMHFWLCLTLNMACFLWWLRTRASTAWLGWIAAGSAACGLHLTGIGVLAIQPIFLLTQRRAHWWHGLLFVLGLGLIVAGPLGYYYGFNRFGEKIEEEGWRITGITWVEQRNAGYGATALSLDSAAAYLFAYNYILESMGGRIPEHIWNAAVATMGVMLVLFLIGALPWSRRLRGQRADDPPPQPWWRSCFWLACWIVVPTIAGACFSLTQRVSPADALAGAAEWLSHPWLRQQPHPAGELALWRVVLESRAFFIIPATVLIGAMTLLWRYIPRILAATTGYAVVVALVLAYVEFGSLMPLVAPTEPVHAAARNAIVLGLVVLAPPLLWYFSGATLAQRFASSGQFLLVAGGLLALWWILDAAITRRLGGSVWMPRYLAFIWPAVAVAACALLVRLPTRPLRYIAVAFVLGVNLLQSGARVLAGNEPPLPQVSADVVADYRDPTVLTFTQPIQSTSEFRLTGTPGTGVVLRLFGRQVMDPNEPGRYYLIRDAGLEVTPRQFRDISLFRRLNMRPAALPGMIASEVARHPEAQRVIVWHQLPIDPPPESEDVLGRTLGPQWRLHSEQLHKVRFYWSWSDLYTYRRREYVRLAPPATQPADAPQPTGAVPPG